MSDYDPARDNPKYRAVLEAELDRVMRERNELQAVIDWLQYRLREISDAEGRTPESLPRESVTP